MIITHLNKRYLPHIGGVERALHDIARACARRGDQVSAIVCAEGPRRITREVERVRVIGVPTFGVLQSVPIAPSYVFLPRQRQTIWHVHEPFPLATIAMLVKLAREPGAAPFVVTWHFDVVRQQAMKVAHAILARRLLARAARIHVATEAHVRSSGVLPEFAAKVSVIPYIVDVERFARAPAHPLARRIRAWADGRPVALFVGRFVYYKGLDVLLDALAASPRVALALVGDGPLRGALARRAEARGVANRLLWLGTVSEPDLPGAYSGADFFVLPSTLTTEAFGLVQVEAMASGLPVIGTRLGTGADTVNVDGVTGALVNPSDPRELAQAMRALAEDRTRREALARAALDRAREFGEGRLTERYRALYAEVGDVGTDGARSKTG